jgi:probable HAF family extracellular repeat protein
MKSILTSIAAGSLLAGLAMAQQPRPYSPQPRYTVTDLGTLGGTSSNAYGPNVVGWVAGNSNLVLNGPQHAFLWYGFGQLHDLGTLGGSNCPTCNSVAYWPNAFGEAAITSETSKTDPNGEDFCGYGTHHQCLGAIWRSGFMTALPTLPGGNNASAYGLNDQGQAIGYSENGTRDATCVTAAELQPGPSGTPFQVLRFEAVTWGPNGEIQELHPLLGDTVGYALGVNNSGQVVGGSGLCSNTSEVTVASPHAVLWERDGSPTDLGHLEGTAPGVYNMATSVNSQGEVVGAAQSKDGTIHAFLWTRETGMQDYGAYGGAIVTVPPLVNTINNRGQIVGLAISMTGVETALIWQGKTPVALNTLIPKNSGWYLQCAQGINDAGEISGFGLINGEVHAFLATPR